MPSASALAEIVASWPQLADPRPAAARAPRGWQQAVSRTSSCSSARVDMVSAVLAQQSRSAGLSLVDEIGTATVVLSGANPGRSGTRPVVHCSAGASGLWAPLGTGTLPASHPYRSTACPPQPRRGRCALRLVPPAGGIGPDRPVRCPWLLHTVVLCGAALASGLPWATALRVLSSMRLGSSCNEGRGFLPSYGLQLPSERVLQGEWSTATISTWEDCGPPVTVWFDATCVVLLSCSSSMLLRALARPARCSSALSVVCRPGDSGELLRRRRPSRWFPGYICMLIDEHCHVTLPKNHVTSIVERSHVRAALFPNMDGVTRARVFGSFATQGGVGGRSRTTASWKPKHKLWEDGEAKQAIGPKAAHWFVTGALDYVPPDMPPPILVEPQSAVPKKGKDRFCNITDAREGNKCLDELGVRCHSARDFGDGLSPCAITFGQDVETRLTISTTSRDARANWCGATPSMSPCDPQYESLVDEGSEDEGVSARPQRRPQDATGDREPLHRPVQKLVFGWRLHVGCDPMNCSRSCDKAHAGVNFDRTLARWAVPHFGQSPAGSAASALNAIALCLLLFMASRNPAPGKKCGASESHRQQRGIGRRFPVLHGDPGARAVRRTGGRLPCVPRVSVAPSATVRGLEGAMPQAGGAAR